MLFEKVGKRRIITFYFKTSTVDVGECTQPQQHWSKHHSKVVTPQERLISIIRFFAEVFSSFSLLWMLAMLRPRRPLYVLVGRRGSGPRIPWILKISAIKFAFVVSSGKKQISPLLATH